MLKTIASIALLFAVACSFGSFATAQSCSTCDPTSVAGGHSHASGNAKSDWQAFRNRANLDYSRNAAWPAPFNTVDRQTYRAMFQPCFDRGWEIEHTLSDACFDATTGKLNNLGAAKVAQVVQAAPSHRKMIYVHQSSSEFAASNRMTAVLDYVQYEFGRSAGIQLAVTKNFPVTGRGSYAESITRQFQENLPPPVLQAQTVSGALTNN